MVLSSFRRWLTYLLLPVLGGFAPVAFAGATGVALITYEPQAVAATSVPTLSEWGLMAMVGLLVLVAYRVLRARLPGKPLASVVLAGVLGLGVVAGGYWGRPALAAELNPFEFSNALGGSYTFTMFGEWQGTNTSTVPQKITAMSILVEGYGFVTPAGTPVCTVGMVVPVGGTCNVRLVVMS